MGAPCGLWLTKTKVLGPSRQLHILVAMMMVMIKRRREIQDDATYNVNDHNNKAQAISESNFNCVKRGEEGIKIKPSDSHDCRVDSTLAL